jgi:exodeoxyribonuclease VII small subunit
MAIDPLPHVHASLPRANQYSHPERNLSNVTSKSPTEAPLPSAADFERSLAELESIVDKLEQGDLSLDESLQQFERGVQLTRACQSALKQAEQKVEILLRKNGEADQLEAIPFNLDERET